MTYMAVPSLSTVRSALAAVHEWLWNGVTESSGVGDPPHVGPECSQAPCGLCSTPCYSVAHITYVSNSQSLGEQRGFHSSVHGKIREQMTSHTTLQTNHTTHWAFLFFPSSPIPVS